MATKERYALREFPNKKVIGLFHTSFHVEEIKTQGRMHQTRLSTDCPNPRIIRGLKEISYAPSLISLVFLLRLNPELTNRGLN